MISKAARTITIQNVDQKNRPLRSSKPKTEPIGTPNKTWNCLKKKDPKTQQRGTLKQSAGSLYESGPKTEP